MNFRTLSFPRNLFLPKDKVSFGIVVDSTPGMAPLLNKNGWPANEVSLLLKLNEQGDFDSALARSLENKLDSLPAPQVDNSGKSDLQIIDEVIPRSVGTIGEYLKYVDSLPISESEKDLMKQNIPDSISSVDDVDSSESPSAEN